MYCILPLGLYPSGCRRDGHVANDILAEAQWEETAALPYWPPLLPADVSLLAALDT
jgi:hypothetical protein